MLTLNQTKTNTGEDDGWSAKWWSKRKGSLTDDRRSDGWSVMTEWGEREVRWSVRGRGWWSVWQKQWVCGRNSEWERVYSLILKNILFETESQRLGFQIWNRVSETRFPRFQPEVQVEATSKSSLKYSIFTWRPPGPPATSGLMKTSKPSLKDSIYGFKIEPLRLEMLVSSIVYKLDLLTKWLANYG